MKKSILWISIAIALVLASCSAANDALLLNKELMTTPAPQVKVDRQYLTVNDVTTLSVTNPKEGYTYFWNLSGKGTVDSKGESVEFTAPPQEGETTIYCYGVKTGNFKTEVTELKIESLDFITGNVLWLKADSISDVTADGEVTKWSDSSGTGNHFIEADNYNFIGGPSYQPEGFNGKPSVRFDGNHMLVRNSFKGLLFKEQATAFIVFKNNSLADNRFIINSFNNVYNFFNLRLRKQPDSPNYSIRFLTWDQSYGDIVRSGVEKDRVYHYSMRFNGTLPDSSRWDRVNIRVNGQRERLEDIPQWQQFYAWTSTGIVKTMTLGNQYSLYNRSACWSGDIAEIMVFDHLLTPEKHAKIEKYLEEKWGK